VSPRIAGYEILGPLGKGGMGEVYRARDVKLNREVAIKVLPTALADDADYRERFTREARVLAALNHPNIATIHGLEAASNLHGINEPITVPLGCFKILQPMKGCLDHAALHACCAAIELVGDKDSPAGARRPRRPPGNSIRRTFRQVLEYLRLERRPMRQMHSERGTSRGIGRVGILGRPRSDALGRMPSYQILCRARDTARAD